jgi:hypothetical protein
MNRRKSASYDDIEIMTPAEKFNAAAEAAESRLVKSDNGSPALAYDKITEATNYFEAFYKLDDKNFIKYIGADDDQIKFLNTLHIWRRYGGYISGRLLYLKRAEINKAMADFESGRRETKPIYQSLEQWFDQNYPHNVHFSYSTGKEYIYLFENTDPSTAQIGVKKVREIENKVIDERAKEQLKREAVELNLTTEALKKRIEEVNEKTEEREKKAVEFEKKIRPKLPGISIYNDKDKKKRCILEFDSQDDRDLFNNHIFDKYSERMRVELFELKKKGVK